MADSRERMEELVAQFLERRERGEAVDAETFLRENLDESASLRPLLAALNEIERRFDAVAAANTDRVGPYRIECELGSGASGSVHLARDAEGRELAVKVLRGVNALSPRARERFEREAARLCEISHPNVARFVDADVRCAEPWIAMERVQGRSLAAEIAAARAEGAVGIAPERAARLALDLARGVEAVHAAGLVHRDVKPANALLDADGRVVLVDFGLVHDEDARTLTRTGDLIGTPQYMAPEQARGERADERTDVWAVGAVLYELLTLRPPHGTGDPISVLERARSRAIARPRRLVPGVPADLERIVVRALAPSRARRTASAAELARDLAAFLEGAPVRSAHTSAFERVENVWRFHKFAVLAALVVVLVFAVLVPLVQRELAREHELARAAVERAAADWVGADEGERRAAVERLADVPDTTPWSSCVLAMLANRDAPSGESAAEAAAARGRIALAEERRDDALLAFQEAKAAAPGSIVPLVLLADAAEAAQKRELAVRELRAALELVPDSAPLLARLSALHYSLKDDGEAERAIRAAIALAPNAGRHQFQLARVLGRAGRKEEALTAALRGDELSGDRSTTFELQILASQLNAVERHAEARAVFERVLRIEPDDARALYNLAFTEMSDHRFPEAIVLANRMIANGEHGRGHATLAWYHAGANRAQCERCREYFAAHADAYDPARAEEHALRSLDRIQADETVPLVAQIAVTIGRRDALRTRLTELKDAAKEDRRIALFERALRVLR